MRNELTTLSMVALFMLLPATVSLAQDDPDPGWSYDRGLNFVSEDGSFELAVKNRTQVRLTGKNPDFGDESASFDIARHKLQLSGRVFEDWQFGFQANLTDNENSPRALEDAYFRYTAKPLAQAWVGQGKVFFGRQQLTSSANLQFIERSIVAEEFRHGDAGSDTRDVGVAVIGQNRDRTYEYSVGLYNGNGINKDEDDNTDYMVVGRLVMTPLGEFSLNETDLERPETSRVAIGVAARTLTEGTEAINEERRDSTASFEVAYKIHGLNLTGEFYTRSADPPLGVPGDEEDTDGWFVQGGWLFRNRCELVGRFSEILREVPNDDETEVGIGFNYYFTGHDYKLQVDYRKLDFEGVPVTPEIDRDELRVQFQFNL